MNPDVDFDMNDFLQRTSKVKEAFGSDGPPSMEKFLEMLENVKDMSDDEKEEMKKDIIMRAIRAAQMGGQGSDEPGRLVAGPREYLTFAIMIFLLIAVFGFFGYKLYQSLMEKENKRAQKQQMKQQKKKK